MIMEEIKKKKQLLKEILVLFLEKDLIQKKLKMILIILMKVKNLKKVKIQIKILLFYLINYHL